MMLYRYLKRRVTGMLLPLSLCVASVIVLLSACNSSTSPASAGAATATPSASGVATATVGSTSTVCAGLDAIIQRVQTGHQTAGFNMSAQPSLVVKGALTTYTPGTSASLSGTGFIVTPNDKVTIQLNRSAQAVTITITDRVSAQTTTYSVSTCTATSSTILTLTGTAPTSFTVSLNVTPS